MRFGALENVIYIVPVAVLSIVLLLFYAWWRRYSINKIFNNRVPQYLKSGKLRIFFREILLLLSIILIVISLLRPQWGTRSRPITKQGSDLLVILDISRSMNSEDVSPSRLERAKNALKFISTSLEGDRIGLVVFAGESFLMCPFTSDIGAFHMFLDSINTETISLQGTDIGGALDKAVLVFRKKKMTNRLALLITDGEDHENKVMAAVKTLKDNDVRIFTAGLGKSSGVPIPLKSNQSDDLYKRDTENKLVKSRLNKSLLARIAKETSGKYIDINNGYSSLKILKDELEKHKVDKSETRIIKEPIERYQVFIVLLIVFLTLEMFLVRFEEER
jgi:Ca-activated chloride channel family protein